MMNFDEIIRNFKNKVYQPVYFLHGEEPYYIDRISDYIEAHVLNDMEKEFNQTVLYGRDTDVLSLLAVCKRFPMMSNYQVVIVKEAQDIKGLVLKSEDDDNNPFINYLQSPQKSTLLVLCYKYKTIDKRTRLAKALAKHSEFFESKKLYDDKIPQWIMNYSATQGYKTDERAAMLLSEYIGNDLSRLANEIDKLCINIDKKTQIDSKLVEKYIGISKEFNVFELQNAIGTKNILKANRIVNYFASNTKNNPLVLTLGTLSGFFNKLMMYHTLRDKNERVVAGALGINPFFVRDYSKAAYNYHPVKLIEIFSLLRECDLRSKGVKNESVVEGDLLKELVFRILH